MAGAVGAVTGIGTGAGTGARWGSGGPAVGGLSGPVFLALPVAPIHAWRGSTEARAAGNPSRSTPCVDALAGPSKTNGPALRGRLLSEVPTSDRAGTGGIQMFLSDIDVERFVTSS
ncbi:hypothetical protein C1924_19135 [Stenotrophomonas sp. ESTM1D_MKCIP4_1]|nr:hypothetical protein C1924_19135 [Stenotrophomonas sp. ESTM1D_MKCIP4_1]